MNRETFLNELMAGLTQLGPVEQRQVAAALAAETRVKEEIA